VAECCRAADWHACPARSRSSRRLCSSTSASARAAGATNPGTHADPLLDNIEGMAIGHGAGGGRRELFLISDDNFGAGQVTRVSELAIDLGR